MAQVKQAAGIASENIELDNPCEIGLFSLRGKNSMNRSILWFSFLCLLLVGCKQTTSSTVSTTEAKSVTLTISAASSLKDAMTDIKQIYSQSKPNVAITYNFDGSGILQQQIEQGAPVDIFISAASKNMDALQEKGLVIVDTRKNLLTNKVVLIVPKSSPTISDFKNLTDANIKKIGLAEPESVPAGKYAREVLTSIGIFEQVKPKTVFAKNVRQVLTYVETGNVDAGIVYETDANFLGGRQFTFPDYLSNCRVETHPEWCCCF